MKTNLKTKGYFSDSYAEARSRFLKAASDIKAEIFSYKLDSVPGEDLTIDVAIKGNHTDPALVVSSGVHGLEGYFGSAVQLAWLEKMNRSQKQENIRYIFIHSVNPYGFAHGRRVNEENIDLNRNFLSNPEEYKGAPEAYGPLDNFLNPVVPPGRHESFYLKAFLSILRHGGLQPLKNAIAGGQYEFPKGIFFGGKGPSQSTQLIQQNSEMWLSGSKKIMHIDLHTGLGASGTYKILLTESVDSPKNNWYAHVFGKKNVELLNKGTGTAYKAPGNMGEWMLHHFSDRDYRFVTAEFGTHFILRMLKAMRIENSIYHHGNVSEKYRQQAKNELRECFYPEASEWRIKVLHSGLQIVEQGLNALKML